MKCGICDGQHLTIHCLRLSRNEQIQASSADIQASAQPKAQSDDSQRPLTPSPNTASPNGTVDTATPNMSPNRRARYRASHLEQHRSYMREYMRSYRARKVPG